MKRTQPSVWTMISRLILLYSFMLPVHAGGVEIREVPIANLGSGLRAITPVSPESLKIENPASPGGVSLSILPQVPGAVNILPLDSVPTAAIPAIEGLLPQAVEGLAQPVPTALGTVEGLSQVIDGAQRSGAAASL